MSKYFYAYLDGHLSFQFEVLERRILNEIKAPVNFIA